VRTFVYSKEYITHNFSQYSLELMCHPGHPAYEEETKSLNMISGAEIINYNNL